MRSVSIRRTTAAFLLTAALTSPGAAAETRREPSHRAGATAPALQQLLSGLLGRLAGLLASWQQPGSQVKSGCILDPSGGCLPGQTPVEIGCGLDPDGQCFTEIGCGIDPSGQCGG